MRTRPYRLAVIAFDEMDLLDVAAPDLCLRFLAEIEGRYRQGEYLDEQVQELVAGHRRALEAQALPLDELWQHLRGFDAVHGDPTNLVL